MTVKVFADRATVDKINQRVYELGGSVPADNFCTVPNTAAEQFILWLQHIGVGYEQSKPQPEEIKNGHLIANHVALATFGRGS